jgi:hypothetical protein
VLGELVTQRQGRGGEQGMTGVGDPPGRAGMAVGQVQGGSDRGLGQQPGHQVNPLAEVRGGEHAMQAVGDLAQRTVGQCGRRTGTDPGAREQRGQQIGVRIRCLVFTRRGPWRRTPLVDQPDKDVGGQRIDQHDASVTRK